MRAVSFRLFKFRHQKGNQQGHHRNHDKHLCGMSIAPVSSIDINRTAPYYRKGLGRCGAYPR